MTIKAFVLLLLVTNMYASNEVAPLVSPLVSPLVPQGKWVGGTVCSLSMANKNGWVEEDYAQLFHRHLRPGYDMRRETVKPNAEEWNFQDELSGQAVLYALTVDVPQEVASVARPEEMPQGEQEVVPVAAAEAAQELTQLAQTEASGEMPVELVKATPRLFDQAQAGAYESNAHLEMESFKALLGGPFFLNAQHILDFGCGNGKIAALLAKDRSMSMIVGCDPSKAMVQLASSQYNAPEYPNLRFIQKNSYELGFTNQLDRVVSFHFFQQLDHQQEALIAIQSALKPGGKVFLSVIPKSDKDDLQGALSKVKLSSGQANTVSVFYTEEEYRQMLMKARFSIQKMEMAVRHIVFENRQALEGWLTSQLLLPEARTPFFNALFAELQKAGRVDVNGKIYLRVSNIDLIASKTRN